MLARTQKVRPSRTYALNLTHVAHRAHNKILLTKAAPCYNFCVFKNVPKVQSTFFS